jgi:hypothetical protein
MQCRELQPNPNHDEICQLFFEAFSASENEEEARVVKDLVHRYMSNYPREYLRGFVAIEGPVQSIPEFNESFLNSRPMASAFLSVRFFAGKSRGVR